MKRITALMLTLYCLICPVLNASTLPQTVVSRSQFKTIVQVEDSTYIQIRELCTLLNVDYLHWDSGASMVTINDNNHTLQLIDSCHTGYLDGEMFDSIHTYLPRILADGRMYILYDDIPALFSYRDIALTK